MRVERCDVEFDQEGKDHCPHHREYEVKRKPRGNCIVCWALWNDRTGTNEKRNKIEE